MNKNRMKFLTQGFIYSGFFALIAIPFAVGAKDIYTRFPDGRIEYIAQEYIKLDNLSEISEKKLDLSNFNSTPPAECFANHTFCKETTEIVVTTKKVWRPVKLSPITSSELSSEDFGRHYPDLKSINRIDSNSNKDERLIAQRILYEVGLLPVLPTGYFGFLTEIATLKLQCAAGFEEFAENGKAVMGEKTVDKLKELKIRLSDPIAIASRPVPNRDFSTCAPLIQNRAMQISDLMGLVADGKISGGPFGARGDGGDIAITNHRSLNLDGEAVIKRQ